MSEVDVSHERYTLIRQKIQEARDAGNSRALKVWKNKLEQWQRAYGAYAPVRRA
jgi:hypothetical protein